MGRRTVGRSGESEVCECNGKSDRIRFELGIVISEPVIQRRSLDSSTMCIGITARNKLGTEASVMVHSLREVAEEEEEVGKEEEVSHVTRRSHSI